VWHNGNFYTAYVGLALDAVRAALFQTAALSAARLAMLVEPGCTGLTPFLAVGPSRARDHDPGVRGACRGGRHPPAGRAGRAGRRGAVARRRGPCRVLTQAARATTDVTSATDGPRCELTGAVRALRMRGISRRARLAEAFALAGAALPDNLQDGRSTTIS